MGGALKRVQTFRGPQNLSLRHFQAQIFVESCDFEVIHLSMLMFQRLPYITFQAFVQLLWSDTSYTRITRSEIPSRQNM